MRLLSHAIFTFTPLVESRAEAIYELISQKATSGPPEHMGTVGIFSYHFLKKVKLGIFMK